MGSSRHMQSSRWVAQEPAFTLHAHSAYPCWYPCVPALTHEPPCACTDAHKGAHACRPVSICPLFHRHFVYNGRQRPRGGSGGKGGNRVINAASTRLCIRSSFG